MSESYTLSSQIIASWLVASHSFRGYWASPLPSTAWGTKEKTSGPSVPRGSTGGSEWKRGGSQAGASLSGVRTRARGDNYRRSGEVSWSQAKACGPILLAQEAGKEKASSLGFSFTKTRAGILQIEHPGVTTKKWLSTVNNLCILNSPWKWIFHVFKRPEGKSRERKRSHARTHPHTHREKNLTPGLGAGRHAFQSSGFRVNLKYLKTI